MSNSRKPHIAVSASGEAGCGENKTSGITANISIVSRSPSPSRNSSFLGNDGSLYEHANGSGNFTQNTTLYHQVEIKPRSDFNFFVRADEPLETLHFSFYTRKKTIAFGLFYLYLPQVSGSSSSSISSMDEIKSLPIGKVKDLIASSRDSVRIGKLGQEGSLARTLSSKTNRQQLSPMTALNSPVLALGGLGSRCASADNLSVTSGAEDVGQSTATSASLMKIGELIAIFPIQRYDSFDFTIHGSYTVPLAGTYVLLFDNTFSISKSKHLFYHAYLSNDLIPSPSSTPQLLSNAQVASICAAGWLEKKRAGVMRTWSRRWFQLDSSGVLSYFSDRASPLRGSIFVPDCSLIIAKNSLRFSLDSGNQIIHIRALKRDDFDFWIQVFHSFRHFGPPTTIASSQRLAKFSEIRSEDGDSLKAVANRAKESLEAVRQKVFLARSDENLEAALQALEASFQLLQQYEASITGISSRTVSDERDVSKRTVASDLEMETDEIFYDVEEIYVDDFDDDRQSVTSEPIIPSSTTSLEESEEEVYEAALDLVEDEFKTFIRQPLSPTVGRILTEWILKADIGLERDSTPLYRSKMTFPSSPITISFASMLMRKTFPAALNEPINLLQKLAEELEYSELLDSASRLQLVPLEQLMYVAAFAVSSYASGIHRTERKPVNPLLGETFEYIRPDRGFRFVSEKVSHQPVIVACHAESGGWEFWQDMQAETKLWGKSMIITPKGRSHLRFVDPNDRTVCLAHYSWNKVTSALRNVYSAKKSIENYGLLVVRNERTGQEARITFKESGLFSNSGNEIVGGIFTSSRSENALINVRGRWDDVLFREVSSFNNLEGNSGVMSSSSISSSSSNNNSALLQVIWKVNPMPSNYAQFFNLPFFAITLNDLPELLKTRLPQTDSRLRPDQRMLESGMIDAADVEKQKLEQLQRDRRLAKESSGREHHPIWFNFDRQSRSWIFNGRYWQERESQFTKTKLPKLW